MNGAVPIKMMRISSGPSFSVLGNQFAADFNPGVALIPSNNNPSAQRPNGTPPVNAFWMPSGCPLDSMVLYAQASAPPL
jgi:hypothetical protein